VLLTYTTTGMQLLLTVGQCYKPLVENHPIVPVKQFLTDFGSFRPTFKNLILRSINDVCTVLSFKLMVSS